MQGLENQGGTQFVSHCGPRDITAKRLESACEYECGPPSGGLLSVQCAPERKINTVIITVWQRSNILSEFKSQCKATNCLMSSPLVQAEGEAAGLKRGQTSLEKTIYSNICDKTRHEVGAQVKRRQTQAGMRPPEPARPPPIVSA